MIKWDNPQRVCFWGTQYVAFCYGTYILDLLRNADDHAKHDGVHKGSTHVPVHKETEHTHTHKKAK